MPGDDTPGYQLLLADIPAPGSPDGSPAEARALAAEQWRLLAPAIAQAPRMRLSPDGGASFPKWHKGRGYEHPLDDALPYRPATVPVFHAESQTGRLLVADFDVTLAQHTNFSETPRELVTREATAFAELIERLGGRCIHDRSPSGGRHVYVLFAAALPYEELRRVAQALARRYATLDASPMSNVFGQIRPPGAGHKLQAGRLTGWMRLDMPLDAALDAVRRPCGPKVWDGLLTELTAELHAVSPVQQATFDGPTDAEGEPWLPLIGGRRPIRADLDAMAQTGDHLKAGYPDRSRARLAVLNSAAAAGWRLAEVLKEMHSGRWRGLASFYGKYGSRDTTRITAEWRKSVIGAAGDKLASRDYTRRNHSTPPELGEKSSCPESVVTGLAAMNPRQLPLHRKAGHTDYQRIRTWWNAVWLAERDPDRQAEWGRRAVTVRKVLRALGKAAQMRGSLTVEFGVRSLSIASGLHWTTVADVLVLLRSEDDPLIDLVTNGEGVRADVYQLRVPEAYRKDAAWRRWRAGLIEGIHPAFWELSGPSALLYEVLSTEETKAGELVRLSALSDASVWRSLKELAAYGLAVKGERGWRRGEAALEDVAKELGTDKRMAELVELYREQRREWHELLGILKATKEDERARGVGPDETPISELADLLAQSEPPPWVNDEPDPPDGLPIKIPDEDPEWLSIWRHEVEDLGLVVMTDRARSRCP
ncbi:hypothetical protein ACFHYQ_08460 [Sphaerimonospora cavernae]|uniref:Uncharacterized protein n=1 Tax=Sphaerimonospora cavernae TaxID=1740611 RepID=A0ABV6U2X9_9ACTN